MNGESAFAAALLDANLSPPGGLSTWNGSDPAARFAVYRNNVIVSLIDALADTYPVTQQLVGEAFFRAMARLYVNQSPPQSRVLAFYGESFPSFIAQFPPAASVPYLPDVARLEMLRVKAYHAADAASLPAAAIGQVLADIENLPQQQVELHPSLGLLQSSYAIASIWSAHQDIDDLSTIDTHAPEITLVLRPNLDVEIIRIDAAASEFIAQLLQGEPLGVAVDYAHQIQPDFDLVPTLALLIQSQAIVSIQLAHNPKE